MDRRKHNQLLSLRFGEPGQQNNFYYNTDVRWPAFKDEAVLASYLQHLHVAPEQLHTPYSDSVLPIIGYRQKPNDAQTIKTMIRRSTSSMAFVNPFELHTPNNHSQPEPYPSQSPH